MVTASSQTLRDDRLISHTADPDCLPREPAGFTHYRACLTLYILPLLWDVQI